MASKRYNRQNFSATVNGEEIRFTAWTTDTYSGYCETVRCTTHGISDTKQSWCGRDWQRFDYESALKRAIEKFPKGKQASLYRQLIDRVAEEEEKKAEEQINTFQKIYNDCSPRQKEMLAKSNIVMKSDEDVKAVQGLMILGQLMGI